ncbi:MAG: hypothetical protein FWE02_07255 [Defluviitaleaceae bacterium]|nr:hypothetical protein [Defluviitaleaceae bacterium]
MNKKIITLLLIIIFSLITIIAFLSVRNRCVVEDFDSTNAIETCDVISTTEEEPIYEPNFDVSNDVEICDVISTTEEQEPIPKLDFGEWATFEEIYEIVMAYNNRLEPFINDFYVQINEIIQDFYVMLKTNDSTIIQRHLASNTILIENADFNSVDLVRWVLNFVEHSESWAGFFSTRNLDDEFRNNRSSTYLVNVSKHNSWGDRINFAMLYNDFGGTYTPKFTGIWLNYFSNISFMFETEITDSSLDPGWHLITHGVSLSLENLHFRISSVTVDS